MRMRQIDSVGKVIRPRFDSGLRHAQGKSSGCSFCLDGNQFGFSADFESVLAPADGILEKGDEPDYGDYQVL